MMSLEIAVVTYPSTPDGLRPNSNPSARLGAHRIAESPHRQASGPRTTASGMERGQVFFIARFMELAMTFRFSGGLPG